MATRKRKIAEVNRNARIDSFYKPIPKESFKKPIVSNDENDYSGVDAKRSSSCSPQVSPFNSQEQTIKVFAGNGSNSDRKPFGDIGNTNKTFGEKQKLSTFKPKVLAGQQKPSVSKSVRQPLQEKSTAAINNKKENKDFKPNSDPEFKVLRDVETSQKGLNTQSIKESDTLCTQYTDLTSSPLNVFGDSDDNDNDNDEADEEVELEQQVNTNDNGLYVYDENKHTTTTSSQETGVQSPLVVYHDSQNSELVIYKDTSNHSSPLVIYRDENASNHDSPLAVYKDENASNFSSPLVIYKDENASNQSSPLIIYKDEQDNCDSPLVIYHDEPENADSPLVIFKDSVADNSTLPLCKDEDKERDPSYRAPLAVKYNAENEGVEDDDEPPFIIFKDDDDTNKKDAFNVANDKEDEEVEDSLGKMITADVQEDGKVKDRSFLDNAEHSKGLKNSLKSLISDNYTTIDDDFFDGDGKEDQLDYADVSFYDNDFSVTNNFSQNTFSQESIESTPAQPISKSPLLRPISVLGSKTFFSKYGTKK